MSLVELHLTNGDGCSVYASGRLASFLARSPPSVRIVSKNSPPTAAATHAQVYSAQDRYNLPSPGPCSKDGSVMCEQWVLHVSDHASLPEDVERPEVSRIPSRRVLCVVRLRRLGRHGRQPLVFALVGAVGVSCLVNDYSLYARPCLSQVFLSGCLHGDEQVGPNAVLEAAKIMVYAAVCQADGSAKARLGRGTSPPVQKTRYFRRGQCLGYSI